MIIVKPDSVRPEDIHHRILEEAAAVEQVEAPVAGEDSTEEETQGNARPVRRHQFRLSGAYR